ncbi:class I SAM-dependent RNA methyltransferase [Sphingomonas koreensis]|uniref:Class I SAM-dependent RNA methyltransferase n=1 Tax=Sphingomonas koreensis TaxID=93064 RepID=A0AAJ4VBI4_9SPHN|nr:class I SAM-dependent RNA methyltransferase [Sphingomonas koreensis]RSU23525.1 class I SAM-dependent RNA methyltransferase [Sphingomonas koreensis]RSU25405.1 class I SAM-dependent RNA methyltransferase [Sphingomonas koreensis]RSU38395.1 class I SAM-dependent RNA methyltransferase [Sphingomonas koreensis]RSU39049.1 class I SAM-dependent RNA methyltransferase [Sphingomonas koreensis]
MAARGDGVTADGRHAPLAAPGDTLLADGSLRPGPRRQTPPCRHFPECGGCQLQHLDDRAYAEFLTARIAGALMQQGVEAEIRAPALSPPRTRRRATLHAERRGRQVHLGFTEQSSHRLIDLQQCEILDPRLFALLQPLRGLLAAHLPANRRVNVHLALTDQGPDVLVDGLVTDSLNAIEAVTSFAQRHGLARLSVDDGLGPEPRWEPEPVTVTFGGIPVPFPPASFLQATPEGERALVAAVREAIGSAKAVADLFAGLGTFALAMDPGVKVYAGEGAREAILSLKGAAGRAQRPVFAEHRDLFRRPLVPKELDLFDAVILDPPRAGAKEQVEQLAASKVPVIAYVSCNPNTFARDAKTLIEGGYRFDWLLPVGQFRWSTHAELAARFSR